MNEQAIKELIQSCWDITSAENVKKIRSWLKGHLGEHINDELPKLDS